VAKQKLSFQQQNSKTPKSIQHRTVQVVDVAKSVVGIVGFIYIRRAVAVNIQTEEEDQGRPANMHLQLYCQ
jgi:hypothetical protein